MDNEDGKKHAPLAQQGHVSKHVYMMPDSYMALVKELESHWPTMWNSPIQYCIWADAPQFVQLMNSALDTVIQFDSANVDGICKQILDELRVRRGLHRIHALSEYNHNFASELEIRLARAQAEEAPWLQRKQ